MSAKQGHQVLPSELGLEFLVGTFKSHQISKINIEGGHTYGTEKAGQCAQKSSLCNVKNPDYRTTASLSFSTSVNRVEQGRVLIVTGIACASALR